MLVITDAIVIPEEELSWSFARSGGPGGQNVNKVASKVVLRWHLAANTSLPAEALTRLRGQQRRRITVEGDLLIQSQRFRDQPRNRADALDRLRDMVLRSLEAPTPRRPTRPTRGSQRRRLAAKRRRSEVKEGRRPVDE